MANIFARVCTKLMPILFRALDPSGLAVSVARRVLRAWYRDVLTTLSTSVFLRWNFSNFSTRRPIRYLQSGQVTCGETTGPLNDLELNKSSLGILIKLFLGQYYVEQLSQENSSPLNFNTMIFPKILSRFLINVPEFQCLYNDFWQGCVNKFCACTWVKMIKNDQ